MPIYIKHNYQDTQLFSGAIEPKVEIGKSIGNHVVAHKVQNYFIGRTQTIKEVK